MRPDTPIVMQIGPAVRRSTATLWSEWQYMKEPRSAVEHEDKSAHRGSAAVGHAGVLVVDDEHRVLQALRRLLRKENFAATFTDAPQEALDLLRRDPFAVVLSEQRLACVEGANLLATAREIRPETMRILLTGYLDPQAAIAAIKEGAVFGFISKPWQDDELRTVIRQAVARFELCRKNRQLAEYLAVTRDQQIKIVSSLDKTVAIYG